MAEGWYQLRQTVHLFNSELFAFDIHLVSDNAAKIPRRRADVKIEKLWQRSVGHFRKADGGTFWRAPKRYPMAAGKEATFWHMIQEGEVEQERTPDFRRCERIRWPKPVIEHSEDPKVMYWVSVKRRENRIHIWLQQEDYLVVLADRKGFLIPWTAFLVTRNHTRKKLRREYESYWKSKAQKAEAAH